MMPLPCRRCCAVAALACMLSVLPGGCALPELAWQQADDILIGEANDWIDLEPRQEQQLRERLQPWLRDIRRDSLPRYAGFMRELARRIGPGFDLDDARWADQRFDRLYRETVSSFVPVIAPTLTDLSSRQQDFLAREIERVNQDYHDRFIAGRDDGMYAIAERIIDAVERWTGALDPAQRALVHERALELPRTAPAWFRFRRDMQQDLLDEIAAGVPAVQVERTLLRWWVERGMAAPEYDIRAAALRAGLRRLLVELAQSLSPAQVAEARRRLQARAANLQAIADSGT